MTSAVSVDKITIDKNALGQLEVKDGGITKDKLYYPVSFGYTILDEQTEDGATTTLYSAYPKAGFKYSNLKGVIHKVSFFLGKYGAPTGTAYFRIRRVSDNTILKEISFDVSTLPDTKNWIDFTFDTPLILNGEDVYILIEYDGGDNSNYIEFGLIMENKNPNCIYVVYYDGEYHLLNDRDATFKIYTLAYGVSS